MDKENTKTLIENLSSSEDDSKIPVQETLPMPSTIPLTVIKNQMKTNDEMPTKLPKLAWKLKNQQRQTETEPKGKDLPKIDTPPTQEKTEDVPNKQNAPNIKIVKGTYLTCSCLSF